MNSDFEQNRGKGLGWNPALVAGLIAGGALAAGYALSRSGSNKTGGIGESEQLESGEFHFVRTQTIDRPASELWAFWREEENAPRFMKHITSVRHTGGDTSHWVMQVPGGPRIEWDSEVSEERPGKLLAWRTLRGDWQQEGRVLFRSAPGNRGTEVRLEMRYQMPGGKAGKALATLIGRDPQQLGIENLHRFKQLMESGQIMTVAGQPHGKRGAKGHLMQFMFRESEAEQKVGLAQEWARKSWQSGMSSSAAKRVKDFASDSFSERVQDLAASAADVAKQWSKSDAARAVQDTASDVVESASKRWKKAARAADSITGRKSFGNSWNRARSSF